MRFSGSAFPSKTMWLLVGVLSLGGLLVYWVEPGCACGGPEAGPRTYVAAARSALREIRTAQEMHAAYHEGRYAASLEQLRGTTTELERRLAPETGVVARVSGDRDGGWYVVEVGHGLLPGWSCRFGTEGAPVAASGELEAGVELCDVVPDTAAAEDFVE